MFVDAAESSEYTVSVQTSEEKISLASRPFLLPLAKNNNKKSTS
jgi:hypothetical protein